MKHFQQETYFQVCCTKRRSGKLGQHYLIEEGLVWICILVTNFPEKLQNSDPAGEEIAALFAAKLYEEGAANKVVDSGGVGNGVSKWKINRL